MWLPTGEKVNINDNIVENIPLTWGEVTKNGTRVPTEPYIVNNIIKTANLFGEIREKWGSPIGITSGYRPPNVNASVGGASKSRHLTGEALDIYPINGSVFDLYCVVKAIMGKGGTGGLGRGMVKGFVHFDVRPDPLVIWDY